MTAFAHNLIDAKWQPDARLARAGGMAFGCGESPAPNQGLVQPLYGRAQQDKTIEGAGTGRVRRRRKR